MRLLGDLEHLGRMARLIVRVPDPLGLERSDAVLPLLLGSYVRVEIEAGAVEDVLSIPWSALREGHRIWLVDSEQRVQIRDATVVWRRPDSVLIANALDPGDEIVLSGLRVALPGLEVDARPVTGRGESLSPSTAGLSHD
jgi:multidrug efflux pump subunit AcrA (membrane-fusion protein)